MNTSNIFRIRFYRPTKMTSTMEHSPSGFFEPLRFKCIVGCKILTEFSTGKFYI